MNNKTIVNKSRENSVKKTLLSSVLTTASLALGTVLLSQVAFAANVQNLILSGNNKVSAKTVFANLDLKKGQEITTSNINASIASLHSTGLFKNVNVTYKGSNVYITVVENPTINSIKYIGNKNLSTGTLDSAIDLRPNQYFTQGKVDNAVQEIKKKYTGARYSNVQVSHKIIDIGDGRADLVFTITEGAATTVQKVSFVGNSVFSDSELRSVVSSKENSILYFFSSADAYSADKVNYDRELLRRHYLEYGYADFSVISAVADLDEESNRYFITFTIDEGEQYKFGEIEVDSAFSNLPPEELLSSVKGKTGNAYNAVELSETVENIRKQADRKGYSFANVTPIVNRNSAEKTIDVVYTVEGGERVYVDRINIVGNTRTHDQVIRREIRLAEGDAFNANAMLRAKTRLMRLGHFTSVDITTDQGSDKDRIVVNVEVAEKATGSIGISAAYSTLQGLVGELSYGETNLLGSGQSINASLKWAKTERSAQFAFTEPNFMGQDFSAGVNAFGKMGEEKDKSDHLKAGAGFTIGLPVGEFTNVTARYNFTYDNNRTTNSTDYVSAVGFNAVFDSRDTYIQPTEGFKLEADVEFAGLGGNVKYIRAIGKAEGHFEVVKDVVVSGYTEVGAVRGWDNTPLRSQDTFFKGGELVRGFASDGFGPRLAGTATGGKIYAGATVEIVAPISKDAGFYAGLFADVGTLYDSTNTGSSSNVNKVRSSIGASIIWHSPIGPLRADYAYVLTKDGVDDLEPFKFGLAIRY